jgi:hypothetical protein
VGVGAVLVPVLPEPPAESRVLICVAGWLMPGSVLTTGWPTIGSTGGSLLAQS